MVLAVQRERLAFPVHPNARNGPLPGRTILQVVAAALVLGLLGLLTIGCASESRVIPGSRGDALQPGVAVSIDLNDDGLPEKVLLDGSAGTLTITTSASTYRSRDKWKVRAACLADSDGNGLPEIVALVDDPEGRHLGLFGCASTSAQSGCTCRELIVTAALQPQPAELHTRLAQAGGGDLLVLTEKTPTGTRDVVYRWNGFGFTALQ
jgi:hypothetical protein